MDQIPRDVEATVRAAAQSTGGYAGSLPAVYQRARRRRRRTAVASAGAATVLVVAGAGLLLRPSLSPDQQAVPPATAVSPAGVAPAQRLLLSGARGSYRVGAAAATRLGGADRVGELLPDGRLTGFAVTGADNWDRFVGLPDGRIVALGPHDTMPGVRRTDGVGVAGLETRLVVTGADGAVQVQRDVRRDGEATALLTASGTSAYLWRPAGLVRHDLGSGGEQVLVPRRALGVPGVLDGSIGAADLTGDRLVLSRASTPCTLALLDTPGARPAGQLPLGALGCRWVTGLRLAPGGERVAVTYETARADAGSRVAVVRTADGAVLADRAIAGTERAARAKRTDQVVVDVAWQDDRTLRGAVVPTGAGTQEIQPFSIATD